MPQAKSRVGEHYFWGLLSKNECPIHPNGAIHALSTTLKCIVASTTEAELGALLLNMQQAKITRLVIEEMRYPQHPIPVHIDDSAMVSMENNATKHQ